MSNEDIIARVRKKYNRLTGVLDEISHEVIVNLIAGTTTRTGLKIQAELDTRAYQKGICVTDKEFKEFRKIKIQKADFHGEWNYTIIPQT